MNKCCDECINLGRKGEWTGCCDMNCKCHQSKPEVSPPKEEKQGICLFCSTPIRKDASCLCSDTLADATKAIKEIDKNVGNALRKMGDVPLNPLPLKEGEECRNCGHYLKYHQAVRFGNACTYGDCNCLKYEAITPIQPPKEEKELTPPDNREEELLREVLMIYHDAEGGMPVLPEEYDEFLAILSRFIAQKKKEWESALLEKIKEEIISRAEPYEGAKWHNTITVEQVVSILNNLK